jgi:ComEC/Rec2-related protein
LGEVQKLRKSANLLLTKQNNSLASMFIRNTTDIFKYIYIFLAILLILRLLQYIQNSQTKSEPTSISFNYIILDHSPRCRYSTNSYYLDLTDCKQYQLGSVVSLIGSQEVGFDKGFFDKKTLKIQSITKCSSFRDSVKCGFASVFGPIIRLKTTLLKSVIGYIKPHQLSLLKSLLFADRNSLPKQLSLNLETIGMSHVVSVSGLHVSVIVGLAQVALAPFRSKLRVIPLVAVVWSFALIAGLRASVMRASTMISLMLLAKSLFYRKSNSLWILLITIWLMLLFDPSFLISVGFQLSVVATLAILLGAHFNSANTSSSLVTNLLAGELIANSATSKPSGIFTQFKQYFIDTLRVTLVAQLGLLPFIFFYFGSFSLVGLVANPILLWLVPLMIVLWTSSLLILPFLSFLPWLKAMSIVAQQFLVVPINIFIVGVDFFAQFDWLVITWKNFSIWWGVVWYLSLVGLMLHSMRTTRLNKQQKLCQLL